MDFLTSSERSLRMAQIRSKDTKPEVRLRKILHKMGLRYRVHVSTLPGKPDLVFTKYRTVVLVHGCFWHAHGCNISNDPKSNSEFWQKKFQRNIDRDERVRSQLAALGWKVIEVWECEISSILKLELRARAVKTCIVENLPQ